MKVRITLPLVLYTVIVLMMVAATVRTSLMYGLGDVVPMLWSIGTLFWIHRWVNELRQLITRADEREKGDPDS